MENSDKNAKLYENKQLLNMDQSSQRCTTDSLSKKKI